MLNIPSWGLDFGMNMNQQDIDSENLLQDKLRQCAERREFDVLADDTRQSMGMIFL